MMVVSVFLKMLIYSLDYQFSWYERVAVFGNVFVLMSGVFFGIRLFKRQQSGKTSFLQDLKAGMRITALYALFMTAFVYVYYNWIDASYFAEKLQNQLRLAEENGMDLANVKRTGEFVLSPFFQSTVTLVGFLLLGSFYSAMITFLVRKFRYER
jgi:amino acid transporter